MTTLYSKSLWSYNPIPRGCVAFAPLWNPACHGPTFRSIDPFHHTITRVGGVMDGDGFTADGDDYIHLTSPFSAGGTFTAIVWFKQTTKQNTRILMTNIQGGAGKQGMGIGIRSIGDGSDLKVVYDGVAWGDGTFTPTLNTKYMATMVRVGDVSNLYLNAGAGVISTLDAAPQDGGSEIHVGKGESGAGADYYLKGVISEWWYFDRALDASEWAYIHAVTLGRNT